SKMVARNMSIKPCASNRTFFKRGDVLIINDNLKRYAGEVQIVTDTIPNEGYQNFLGSIPKNEMMIVNEIKAGSSVTFLR
ncbi:MAG: phospho-sugar glycosidase domain-containing protein, partial [Erysipelothrix sp.]